MEKQRIILFIVTLLMFLSMIGVAVVTNKNSVQNIGYNLI